MKLNTLKENKWVVFFSNIYVVISAIFIVWMIFFDTNSLMTQRKLKKEIRILKKQKKHLEEKILNDKEIIKKLLDNDELKKFAREKLFFKRKEEELYIIEYEDSLKPNK